MKALKLAVCVLMSLPYLAAAQDWSPFWAKNARGFPVADSAEVNATYAITAPDGQSALRSAQEKVELLVHDKPVADLSQYVGALQLVEAAWSGDDQAVFINASDGGDTGAWTTHAYTFSSTGAHEVPLAKLVGAASTLKSDCLRNMGSVAWRSGHGQLLVVEQVPDTSDCNNHGAEVGYLIDVAKEKIVRTLTPKELKNEFLAELGEQPRAGMAEHDQASKPAGKSKLKSVSKSD